MLYGFKPHFKELFTITPLCSDTLCVFLCYLRFEAQTINAIVAKLYKIVRLHHPRIIKNVFI